MRQAGLEKIISVDRQQISGAAGALCCALLLTTSACTNAIAAWEALQLRPAPTRLRASRPSPAVPRNDAFAEQALWKPINAIDPDVFLRTGDIVYADVANCPPIRGQVR